MGLLVGDALGVPYEFHHPEAIPPLDQIEFEPPHTFDRTYPDIAPGTWSDDGAQALCLMASLLHCNAFQPRDFANRLINWYALGYMAVGGHVFDVGGQTMRAIERLQDGIDPLSAGGTEEFSKGNGSLMRVLPLALWHRGPDAALVRDAHDQSRLTHGHETVQACCALYCLWARRALAGDADAWASAVSALRAIYAGMTPVYRAVLEDEIRPDAPHVAGGSGFVIDSLFSAKAAVEAGPYETAVRTAIAFGQDTDTTACIAGGIAGIRDGIDAIPVRWREKLRELGKADQLLSQLLTLHRT